MQNYCFNLVNSCNMVYDDGTLFHFDDSIFSNSIFSPELVDNIHTKEVSSTNFFLKQKLFIKTADLTNNRGKENREEAGANRNIKASTFKIMARLTGTDPRAPAQAVL